MKTTVEISDTLFAEAKKAAKTKGVSLREMIEMGLRSVLESDRIQNRKFKLRDGSVGGEGPVSVRSWQEIRRLIYEEPGE